MSNWREEVAEVLEVVARDGFPEPRDLDVALDAIASAVSDEIEKLRAAICEWAASIYGYEGVLFLEGLKHEKFINSILDAERDRVEGEQKE